MYRRAVVAFVSLLIAAVAGGAGADTLPLPANLVALDSPEGEALLIGAEARTDYFPLSIHFVTQANPAFCGPATISMVLNALGVERPASELTLGLGLFDQENIFNEKTEAVKPQSEVLRNGMTVDEFGVLLGAHGLKAEVIHASDSDLDHFRKTAIDELGDDDRFVVVNYLRKAIGQEAGGHISPLAAYDADTDRFLILDVSRYKYPPIWVEAAALFAAMNTPDSDNGDKSRGFVIVGR
jgi:hypothetical protein